MVKFIVASHWLIFLLRHNQSDTITVFVETDFSMQITNKLIEQLRSSKENQ